MANFIKFYKTVNQGGRGVKKGQKSVNVVCERPPAIFLIESFKKGNLLQNMPLVSASKEICNLIYIMVQVINLFYPSSDSVVVRVMDSHAAAPGSISGICNGTLTKKVNSLFISKEILKAEISKIGPPYDMDFVEL